MSPDGDEMVYNEIVYLRQMQADQVKTQAAMSSHLAVVNQILEESKNARIRCSAACEKNTHDISAINASLEKINDIMTGMATQVASHSTFVGNHEMKETTEKEFWSKAKDYSGKIALILISAVVGILVKTYLG